MRRWWLLPGVLLLAAYLNLSLLTSPRGFLGTDTGGKVATLRAMDRCNCLDPDIGYWAERWDPDGTLHPLYYARPVDGGDGGDGGKRWVDVTTLPMLLAAYPLYELGGYRAALLLPMAGAIAAALAAMALVRRVAWDAGATAYWVAGLASPLVVYALDFWEHTIGVALIAWAAVLLWDLVDERAEHAWRTAVAALLLGVAATMRTEALVYAAVGAVATGGLLLSRRTAPPRRIAAIALLALPCLAAPLVANDALERAVLGGTSVRAGRAAGTASVAGDEPASRVVEALYTTVAAEGVGAGVVLGVALTAVLALAWRRGRRDRSASDIRFALVLVAAAAALFAVRAAQGGLGFVPGLTVAWALAIGALAGTKAVRRRAVLPLAIAIGAMPVVLLTQYRGGAAPQWGGRYLLPSGLLLTVLAVANLRTLAKPVAGAMVAVAVAVTAFGVAWLAVRSHDVERIMQAIAAKDEPVVVSAVAHLAREGGAFYGGDEDGRRWLTALSAAEAREAAGVVRQAGEDRFLLVQYAAVDPPSDGTFPGFERDGPASLVRLFDGVDLRLTRYRTPVRR